MAKIKFRRDTTANWATANSVLSQGEPGLDITHNALKIGDGTTAWANLEYIANKPYPLPSITYEGSGNLPTTWLYTTAQTKILSSLTGEFLNTGGSGDYYWLNQNFDDGDYDLSGMIEIHFNKIGGIKGYFDFSAKSEVVMTTIDMGEIAVIDEWFNFAGFSNTLTTFSANSLVDVGANFEIYGNNFDNGPAMSFPVLDRIGGTIRIDWNWNYMLNTPAPTFPALTHVEGDISIYSNKYTSWTDFSSLQRVNNYEFHDNTNNDSALYDGPGMPVVTDVFGNLSYFQNDGMQSISEFANLITINGNLNMYNNGELESFPSFPVLTYVSLIYSANCPSMTTCDGTGGFLPAIKWVNGNVNFNGCALNQTSIDSILVKLASLDGTNGTTTFSSRTVDLSGGSNAIPSQTGLYAKSVLEGRGCNVNVNS